MKTAIRSALAGVALLALGGHASAGEPIQLSEAQLDDVTAAGVAVAAAGSITVGNLLSETVAETDTFVDDGVYASAVAASAGLAASVLVPAASVSASVAAAALP